MKFDKLEWERIFETLHLREIAPITDEEWELFFANTRESKNPVKYNNLRKGIILGLQEKKYLGTDFELLCESISALIELTADVKEIEVCNEYLHIVKQYAPKGTNIIDFVNSERVCFAVNRIMRYLLWGE